MLANGERREPSSLLARPRLSTLVRVWLVLWVFARVAFFTVLWLSVLLVAYLGYFTLSFLLVFLALGLLSAITTRSYLRRLRARLRAGLRRRP